MSCVVVASLPVSMVVALKGPTNAWVVILGETYIPKRPDCLCDDTGVYTVLLSSADDFIISRSLSTLDVSFCSLLFASLCLLELCTSTDPFLSWVVLYEMCFLVLLVLCTVSLCLVVARLCLFCGL